jgi:hypothetical protein
MADKTRIRLAAAVTALFLAAISALGIATHRQAPPALTPAAVVAQPPAANPSGRPGGDEAYALEEGGERE